MNRQIMKPTLTLIAALLLLPLAALHAAESQSAIPAKPLAVDQRNASQQTERKPQGGR